MLATFVPPRLHLPCPRRRGRRRRDVGGCVRRRVCRPGGPPRRRRRGWFALVGPNVARPVEVTLRRTGHAMCRHGRVTLRRIDSGRCDGDGRRCDRGSPERDCCHRNSGGCTAKKARHCRPLRWDPVPDIGRAPAYVVGIRTDGKWIASFRSFIVAVVDRPGNLSSPGSAWG